MNLFNLVQVDRFELFCLELAEYLVAEGLVDYRRFTFAEVWQLKLRRPDPKRRITPALPKAVVLDMLSYLVALEVLSYTHGVYRYRTLDPRVWMDELIEPYVMLNEMNHTQRTLH